MPSNPNTRGGLVLLLLFALVGCRPAGLESPLTDPFRESLRTAGEKVTAGNRRLFNALRYEVGQGGHRKEDMHVVKQGEELIEAARALRNQLDILDGMLAKQPPEAHLPESVRGAVKDLSAHLPGFSTLLVTIRKNRPFFPGLPGHDASHLAEEMLPANSASAARLTLARLRAEVTMSEQEAMNHLAARIGSCCFCFSAITPVAPAVSSTVKVGDPYEAELFLGAGYRSGWQVWSATLNGAPVPVISDRMEVSLPPGRIAINGNDSLEIALHLIHKYGRDSILVIRRPYPVIVRTPAHPFPAIKP